MYVKLAGPLYYCHSYLSRYGGWRNTCKSDGREMKQLTAPTTADQRRQNQLAWRGGVRNTNRTSHVRRNTRSIQPLNSLRAEGLKIGS